MISEQTAMYICSVFCSHHFSVKQLNLKLASIRVNIIIIVLFRVLDIKLNLVKLTFWTAISSHQVMGMSLTKVMVIYCYSVLSGTVTLKLFSMNSYWCPDYNILMDAGHHIEDILSY